MAPLTGLQIEGYLAHARRQIDHVERRLLRGETIPHDEKVFSIFENHTRWISKGKAGRPVELGVPVCVLEDQHGFLLYHEILWEGGDTDIAVPMIEAAQARYPDLRACSFDRGFHSPANRLRLDALLEHNVLPRKGRWNRADRVREEDPAFVAARRAAPGGRVGDPQPGAPRPRPGAGLRGGRFRPGGGPLHAGFQHPPPRTAAAAAGAKAGRDDEPPPDGAADRPTGLNPPTGGTDPQAPTAARPATSAYPSPNP